jgi:hypothetical protein
MRPHWQERSRQQEIDRETSLMPDRGCGSWKGRGRFCAPAFGLWLRQDDPVADQERVHPMKSTDAGSEGSPIFDLTGRFRKPRKTGASRGTS